MLGDPNGKLLGELLGEVLGELRWVGCLLRSGELIVFTGRRLKNCWGLGIVLNDGEAAGPAAQGADRTKYHRGCALCR